MKLPRLADAVGVGAAKLTASLAVLATGFRAVSDDDYARIVIAQRFAEAPHLDPSGTSWLPLPFWLYGAAFRLFGGSLAVAHGVAVFLGVGAALLLLSAAHLLGAGRVGAVSGALLAALFPWSVYLGAAAVPEAPTAALCVLGVATLAVEAPRERVLGACALAAACFSRYEAWPVAATFAGFTLLDARRARDLRALLPAALALGPVALWLLHGIFIHGDALFFWTRVAAYKHALGNPNPLAVRLSEVPRWLFLHEPELSLGLALAWLVTRADLQRYLRPAAAMLALFVFLAAGEIAGGGPTHHAERAVLPIWFLLALALGDVVGQAVARRPSRRLACASYAVALVAAAFCCIALEPPHFTARGAETAAGARARELGAPGLLIDTDDYGYLAVTAGFGKPNAAVAFDDHDPRHPRTDAFASTEALRTASRSHPGAWLVLLSRASGHAKTVLEAGAYEPEPPGRTLWRPVRRAP